MDASPFPYFGPLEPDQVRGREALITDLVERVTEHRVTALLGPRRYGKTSLLRRVARDIAEAGVTICWVDLYEAASMADVAVRFDTALAALPEGPRRRASQIASALALNLGLLSVELRAAERDRPDANLLLHSMIDVLVRAAAGTPTVVIIDEFAGIARVPGAAGALRTGLQHHYQELGLVFAGSEPSMMRMLFTDHAEPFYAQADLLDVPPLTTSEVVNAVVQGFEATDRRAGPLPEPLSAFTRGHPQRTMQLADAAWRLVPAGDRATDTTWGEALDAVRAATASGNERLYSSFHDGEKLVLRVLASGGSLFGADGQVLGLANGTAQHARQALVDKGQLVADGGRHRLVDPVFADWIARRFPL